MFPNKFISQSNSSTHITCIIRTFTKQFHNIKKSYLVLLGKMLIWVTTTSFSIDMCHKWYLEHFDSTRTSYFYKLVVTTPPLSLDQLNKSLLTFFLGPVPCSLSSDSLCCDWPTYTSCEERTFSDYNRKIKEKNDLLARKIDEEKNENLKLWHHRGFWKKTFVP